MAFCQRLAAAGCKAIIYTDIACDGAMQGTKQALYRQLAAEVPGVAFTASGGISSEAELLELKKMGTAAANMMIQQLKGIPVTFLEVPWTLIPKGSTPDNLLDNL